MLGRFSCVVLYLCFLPCVRPHSHVCDWMVLMEWNMIACFHPSPSMCGFCEAFFSYSPKTCTLDWLTTPERVAPGDLSRVYSCLSPSSSCHGPPVTLIRKEQQLREDARLVGSTYHNRESAVSDGYVCSPTGQTVTHLGVSGVWRRPRSSDFRHQQQRKSEREAEGEAREKREARRALRAVQCARWWYAG